MLIIFIYSFILFHIIKHSNTVAPKITKFILTYVYFFINIQRMECPSTTVTC